MRILNLFINLFFLTGSILVIPKYSYSSISDKESYYYYMYMYI